MNYMKRIIYLGYYFKTTNWKKYHIFLNFVSTNYKKSKITLIFDSLWSAIRYNISLEEYFMYFFWQQKTSKKRSEWAGAGFMYEYHLLMTPENTRNILKNKAEFLKHNAEFILHKWIHVENKDLSPMQKFIEGIEGKVVIKQVDGNCGRGVEVFDVHTTPIEKIIEIAKKRNFTLAEEYIVQHQDLMRLSPAGLNTVRIITQINNDGGVDILAARIRITINSFIDNLHAGNMASAIDIESGTIILPAIYSDITKPEEKVHPITGIEIVGFQIPRWNELLEKAKAIALHNKENRSVGWDIAVTQHGVDFVEGNHDLNQDIFQMPVHRGLKNILKQYLR